MLAHLQCAVVVVNQSLSEQILFNYRGIQQKQTIITHVIKEHITEIDNILNLQSSIYSAAVHLIPWVYFEESMPAIQMFKITLQYK